MRVALFIPCYVDQLRPRVAFATLELLRATGASVRFEPDALCCGQPFLTAGEERHGRALGRRLIDLFREDDAIVMPSASCVATLRRHLERWAPGPEARSMAERVLELTEFLIDQDTETPALPFPHRVGLHASCHGLRELGLGTATETREPPRRDPAAQLLSRVPGLELVDLTRRDECCGFGGIFAVQEDAVSSRMGLDRLADHRGGGAEVLTSTDLSCLLHLEGLAQRRKMPMRLLHVAEILAESSLEKGWDHAVRDRGSLS
jgi:L-lactate dehydrogenase complex protein LldE